MWYFHRAWFTCGTTTTFLLFPSTLATFLLFSLHQHRYSYIFIVFPPLPPPLLPHFYWFPTTATITKFVLFSLHCHHHHHHHDNISVVFTAKPKTHFHWSSSTNNTTTFLFFPPPHHFSVIFPPPPQLPPYFYNCFPSITATTTTFIWISFHHHHRISIGFPPPWPPPLPHLYCFPSKHISKVPKKFGARTYFSKSCFILLLEHNTLMD